MTTKIDLDELERKARKQDPRNRSRRETLALIARIRELEAALDSALDEWNRRDELDRDDFERSKFRALLEKGAVLPATDERPR